MAKYEMLYLLKSDATEEVKAAEIEKYENIVKSMNGAVVSTDKWGTKKLAYPIKFKTEADYVLMTFEADAAVLKEIERVINIDSEVLRFIVTKLN